MSPELLNLELPVLQPCIPGCGDCCTIVPVSDEELMRVRHYARQHGIEAVRQGLRFPFFREEAGPDGQSAGCQVYPARPFACRLYGHAYEMACPHGKAGPMLPAKEQRRLMETYMQEFVQGRRLAKRPRYLHEIAGFTHQEILELLGYELDRTSRMDVSFTVHEDDREHFERMQQAGVSGPDAVKQAVYGDLL